MLVFFCQSGHSQRNRCVGEQQPKVKSNEAEAEAPAHCSAPCSQLLIHFSQQTFVWHHALSMTYTLM